MQSVGNGNVQLQIEDHRADVVLNRPDKRNAMNRPLLNDLRAALEEVDNDDDVRAMTLLGKGPIFCAGLDLEMMRDRVTSDDFSFENSIDDIARFIDQMTTPSVVSIKGAAIAGAFELILPVDFRIISQDAKYGVIEVSLGLFPSSGATQRLPRLVGLSKAKEIVLTGDYIEPKEAKECGLVHEIVDGREKTDERAREWADKLAKNAPLGMQHARRLLNSAFDMPLDEGLELETVLGEKLIDTHDYEEGFTARIEGREPEFKGE